MSATTCNWPNASRATNDIGSSGAVEVPAVTDSLRVRRTATRIPTQRDSKRRHPPEAAAPILHSAASFALRPVTLLILLAAAAGAGVVAAGLGAADHGLGGSRSFAAHELQLLHLALFLALHVAGEFLHGGFRRLALLLARVGTQGRCLALLFLVFVRERQHRTGAGIHLEEEKVTHGLVF